MIAGNSKRPLSFRSSKNIYHMPYLPSSLVLKYSTPRDSTTFMTFLVETPCMYDSSITESRAFSTLEYLSNTLVSKGNSLICGFLSSSSPSVVLSFLDLEPFLYPFLSSDLSYGRDDTCILASINDWIESYFSASRVP